MDLVIFFNLELEHTHEDSWKVDCTIDLAQSEIVESSSSDFLGLLGTRFLLLG